MGDRELHPSEVAELDRLKTIALLAADIGSKVGPLLGEVIRAGTVDDVYLRRGRLHSYVDVLRELVHRL
ncbi:MAG TPA: hypothetical protein VEB22_11340 [Phycisphaerales bacterium]|nr:hypothetical protein [Phycisphaerales bacterium]